MIGASKILTVSYGTFSCTLEGFDEPFNTMKAIAEYFRDLAAEDRYFGAEPPTPDAAMLHKIAEREIHRRVEAKIQENGVILRTGEALAAPASAPATAIVSAPISPAVIDHEDQPLLSDASVSADSVAAKLSRLRASAAATAVLTAMPDFTTDYLEDEHADEQMIPANFDDANRANAAFATSDASVIENSPLQIEINNQADAPPENGLGDATAKPTEPVQNTDAPENLISTKLPQDEVDDEAIVADDPTDRIDQDALDDLARLDGIVVDIDDHTTALVDQPAAIEAAPPTSNHMADDTLAADDAMLASLGNLINKTDQTDRAMLNDDLNDDFEDEFDGIEDSFADAAPLVEAVEIVAPNQPTVTDNAATSAESLTTEAEDEPEIAQRARARVIKIRRADAPAFAAEPAVDPQSSLLSDEAEAALQAELAALEAEVTFVEPSSIAAQEHKSDVEFEDEFDVDLDAEFDKVATKIAADPTPPPVRPQRPVRSITVAHANPVAVAAVDQTTQISKEIHPDQLVTEYSAPTESLAEYRHDIEGDLADDAVGRLMAQTNSALDGEDVKRRQSAIAHLKGAVAATEADRLVAPNQPKGDLTESYRNDLESAVRPMRPESGVARVANADRPQPLVLVSAQRIDRLPRSDFTPRPEIAARIVAPIRPRRIATGTMAAAQQDSQLAAIDDELDLDEGLDDAAINMFAQTESFADFADRLGASDLPDLLEAAAVYCASVLGRPEFSRPLVLRQVATLPEAADLSREDGLRVFGTLMRQGRITRTRRGQFAVTDRSPILAEVIRSAG